MKNWAVVTVAALSVLGCGGDAQTEVRDAVADVYDGASAISCRYVGDADGYEVFRCTGEGFPPGCYYVGTHDNLVSKDCGVARASD